MHPWNWSRLKQNYWEFYWNFFQNYLGMPIFPKLPGIVSIITWKFRPAQYFQVVQETFPGSTGNVSRLYWNISYIQNTLGTVCILSTNFFFLNHLCFKSMHTNSAQTWSESVQHSYDFWPYSFKKKSSQMAFHERWVTQNVRFYKQFCAKCFFCNFISGKVRKISF
jgi:hypothetical protein